MPDPKDPKKEEPKKDDETAEAFEALARAKDEEDHAQYEAERREAGIKLLTDVRNTLKKAGYDPSAKPPSSWEFETRRGGAIRLQAEPREIIVSAVSKALGDKVTKLPSPLIEYEFGNKQWVGSERGPDGKRQSAVTAVADRVVEGLKLLASNLAESQGRPPSS